MRRLLEPLFAIIVALVFGAFVQGVHLLSILQPMTVALSVVCAGVLVRLARGMPTLDWKSIPIDSRKNLTSHLVSVSYEYAKALVVVFLLLGAVIFVTGLRTPLAEVLVYRNFEVRAAIVGFMIGLAMFRMSRVIWRDLDIVRLQKGIIDLMTDTEKTALEGEEADRKSAVMQKNFRRGATTVAKEEWPAKAS